MKRTAIDWTCSSAWRRYQDAVSERSLERALLALSQVRCRDSPYLGAGRIRLSRASDLKRATSMTAARSPRLPWCLTLHTELIKLWCAI